jgi:hypothetical protein
MSLIWISSALTIEGAETKLVPLLMSTASRIAEAFRDHKRERTVSSSEPA